MKWIVDVLVDALLIGTLAFGLVKGYKDSRDEAANAAKPPTEVTSPVITTSPNYVPPVQHATRPNR